MPMKEVIQKKINVIISRITFKIVMLPDPATKNVVPSRFLLAIKHEDVREVYKARLCLGGHRDLQFSSGYLRFRVDVQLDHP
jgi:hypothetical protein